MRLKCRPKAFARNLSSDKLAQRLPRLASDRTDREATLADLAQHLPEGVAVVDFIRVTRRVPYSTTVDVLQEDGQRSQQEVTLYSFEYGYEAFISRKASQPNSLDTRWVHLPQAKEIDQAVGDFLVQLGAGPSGGGAATSEDQAAEGPEPLKDPGALLRTLLWDQVEPHLDGCETVIVLPTYRLCDLPWNALPGKSADTFLIEDYALATASYGQQLVQLLTDLQTPGDRSAFARQRQLRIK